MKTRFAGLLASLLAVLILAGCSSQTVVRESAGETVHTALFDFTVSDISVVDNYNILVPTEGNKLVQMTLSVTNTGDEACTMFAEDFQLQWGDGDEDFGVCLAAVTDEMVPYSYTLEPGESYAGVMVVMVPEDAGTLTVAYQETLASGEDGTAYFVEASL